MEMMSDVTRCEAEAELKNKLILRLLPIQVEKRPDPCHMGGGKNTFSVKSRRETTDPTNHV